MNSLTLAACILASYVLGSVPAGLLLSRLNGVNIRTVGSGNIGATNVFRSVGKGWGIATFVCDLLKGFIPAILAGHFGGTGLALACGCAAIAGHNWSVFLRFTGGKGVATSAGVLLGIVPSAVLIGFVSWLILLRATRYVAVASMGAAALVAVASWLLYLGGGYVLPITLTVLALLVIYTHRSNIRRLMDGTEHRFDMSRKKGTANER